ncbi:MAG TPA: hypothetical protein VIV07_10570 [Sphingomicrobium sp.]
MSLARPAFALRHRSFGRAPARVISNAPAGAFAFSDDLKLFATTFAAGFLFVSILIG